MQTTVLQVSRLRGCICRLLGWTVSASSSPLPTLCIYQRLCFHSLPISISCYFPAANTRKLVQAVNRGQVLQETLYMMAGKKSIKIAARLRLGLGAPGLFSSMDLMLQGSDTRRYREQPRALVGQDFICFHSHASPFWSCISFLGKKDFLLFITFYPAASLRSM